MQKKALISGALSVVLLLLASVCYALPAFSIYNTASFKSLNLQKVISFDSLFFDLGDEQNSQMYVDFDSLADEVAGLIGDYSNYGDFVSSRRYQSGLSADSDKFEGHYNNGRHNGSGADSQRTGGTSPVPEPATLVLLGAGILGLIGFKRIVKVKGL